MTDDDFAFLALLSLAVLTFVGTFVLGDTSWYAWLLAIPTLLVARSLGRGEETLERGHHQRPLD